MGLVSQVMGSFPIHAFAGIKKIFAALTVAELSEQTFSLPENAKAAESAIASLVLSGTVPATLAHTPGRSEETMLRFLNVPSSPQSSHELELQMMLAGESETLEVLVGSVRKSNNGMGLSDELIDHIHKGQAWTGSSEGHLAIGEDTGLEVDEDIMGDQS